MVSRNPFRVRTAEYFEEEEEFLSLFGLEALDIFDVDDMWVKVQIIRSARGGGKTSILKIFSPRSLNRIYNTRKSGNEMRKLFQRLEKLDVYDEHGPKILGVNLSLFGSYPILKQLGLDLQKQMKFCYALISIRIVLATLRSISELKNLEYPDGLNKIYFKKPTESNISSRIPIPCTAKELYEWALGIENQIFDIIEDKRSNEDKLGGLELFSILPIINAKNIIYDDKPIAKQTLLMLDDVDKLTSEQRIELSKTLCNLRVPIAIWLAERLEALKPEELLSIEATLGREYDAPIILEKFWRNAHHQHKFESLLRNIANKRAIMNNKYNIKSFEQHISNDLDQRWDEKFNKAVKDESERLKEKFGRNKKYESWFKECEKSNDSTINEMAEKWRLLEIRIERDLRKNQKKLDENVQNSQENIKMTSKEKDVAEFYIRKQYEIPYYFGFSKLAKLASSNIQQFLDLSSDLFDEMISSRSFNTNVGITEDRQEKLLLKSLYRYWGQIKTSIPHSKYVIPFLDSVGKLCSDETNRRAASYGPVTGIAISTHSLHLLQKQSEEETNPRYKILADVISTCLAYNLLEPLPDSKQGQRGTTHLILYMNRLLCFWYNLPLSYGGWREKNLDTLCSYYEKKSSSNHKQPLDFKTQRTLEGM